MFQKRQFNLDNVSNIQQKNKTETCSLPGLWPLSVTSWFALNAMEQSYRSLIESASTYKCFCNLSLGMASKQERQKVTFRGNKQTKEKIGTEDSVKVRDRKNIFFKN